MSHSVIASAENTLELSNLLGTWLNVNDQVDFIANFTLVLENDGLLLTTFPTNSTHDIDPVRLIVEPVATVDSKQAAGFFMYQDGGELTLAANEKNGVLVLQAYRKSSTNSLVPYQLTREFYHRQSLADSKNNKQQLSSTTLANRLDCQENNSSAVDFEMLLGHWHNTHIDSVWLKGLTIDKTSTGWSLQAKAQNNECRWPETALIPYYFDREETGFIARCHCETLTSLFCAYSNKGLLVVSAYYAFSGTNSAVAGRKVLCREFYARR